MDEKNYQVSEQNSSKAKSVWGKIGIIVLSVALAIVTVVVINL